MQNLSKKKNESRQSDFPLNLRYTFPLWKFGFIQLIKNNITVIVRFVVIISTMPADRLT